MDKIKQKSIKLFVLITLPLILCGIIGGLIGAYVVRHSPSTAEERMTEYYQAEMATVVSPSALKKMIDAKSDAYILVDLRSEVEYNTEHFATAINIPAVSMNEDQLIEAFGKLDKSKEIIVHCYSAYCTLGRQVGETLANKNIFVKELTIGWSELRYHYDLWNPGAKPEDGEKYIIKGDPNTPQKLLPGPCVDGEFGC